MQYVCLFSMSRTAGSCQSLSSTPSFTLHDCSTILVPFYSVADVNLREINKVHFASIDILLLRVRTIVELEGQKWKIV